MNPRTGAYWTTHHRDADRENVQFLVDNGLSLEAACARVGVTPDTAERRQQRRKEDA